MMCTIITVRRAWFLVSWGLASACGHIGFDPVAPGDGRGSSDASRGGDGAPGDGPLLCGDSGTLMTQQNTTITVPMGCSVDLYAWGAAAGQGAPSPGGAGNGTRGSDGAIHYHTY